MRNDARDVERLFSCLVETLGRANPDHPRTTFQVSELYQNIIPYRTHRSQLGLDSSQDYEMAVLRFLAGEGGYATVEPEEVRDALADEVQQVNPDPGVFREYAGATVRLQAGAVATLLESDRQYAPPRDDDAPDTDGPPADGGSGASPAAPAPPFALDEPPVAVSPSSAGEPRPSRRVSAAESPKCRHCGRALPLHRAVTYCPFCGEQAHALVCKACGGDLEPGWRFCVECGESLGTRRGSGG